MVEIPVTPYSIDINDEGKTEAIYQISSGIFNKAIGAISLGDPNSIGEFDFTFAYSSDNQIYTDFEEVSEKFSINLLYFVVNS